MSSLPAITLTVADHALLEALLEAERGGARHALVERLEEELHRATVVDASPARGLVCLGARVEYEVVETGQRRQVELVLPRAAQGAGRLSVLSPIGCSLIGLSVGDTFTWDAGTHRWRLKVLSVQPPAKG